MIITRVRTKSKGLKWYHNPLFYGIPDEGEDMIWLSYWMFKDEHLEGGDQVVVSVRMEHCFQDRIFIIYGVPRQYEEEEQDDGSIAAPTGSNNSSSCLHGCKVLITATCKLTLSLTQTESKSHG
ncbi:uncharacterized protein Pyn_27423 [Prunus yedoensis var. nudiflora]|uniref:TMV resistance protein N-like n=1 Tax=Prunus yedoensis var. nudiflora TaxID=2094558 RepID=A0A314XIY8_PRUYE|nr:uncharacterized protein Pyn_27423 [Prunus yedoensis var. nudiflora]